MARAVGLLCLLLALCGTASARTLYVVNLTGSPTNFLAGSPMTFPTGKTSVEITAGFLSDWNGVYPWTLTADNDFQLVASFGGLSEFGAVNLDGPETVTDYTDAFSGGFGLGLLWFGFGWKYRLAKQISFS